MKQKLSYQNGIYTAKRIYEDAIVTCKGRELYYIMQFIAEGERDYEKSKAGIQNRKV